MGRMPSCLVLVLLASACIGTSASAQTLNDILRFGSQVIGQVPAPQPAPPPSYPGYQPPAQHFQRTPAPYSPPATSYAPPQQPQPDPAQRQQIATTQALLDELGYDAGPADGVLGPQTRKAIRQFQTDGGFAVTGETSDTLLRRLQGARAGTLTAQPAPAPTQPGFDCRKVQSATEGAICASPQLAGLDRQMSQAYAAALGGSSGAGAAQLRESQRQWIARRNACGADTICIADAYRSRAAVLHGGTQGAGFAENAPEPLRVAGSAADGIRAISPASREGRLLTGYPLTQAPFSRQMVSFGPYNRRTAASSFDLALYFDLVILKQWPDSLKDERLAKTYASRFLTGARLFRYVANCRKIHCDSGGPYQGWAGRNEFEREASYRAFVREIGPQLRSLAPSPPVRMLLVREVTLRSYNSAAGAFPINVARTNTSIFVGEQPAQSRFAVTFGFRLPTQVHVARPEAPGFLEPLEAQQRKAYLALSISLENPTWNSRMGRPEMKAVLQQAALYADPELRRKLRDFDTAPLVGTDTPSQPAVAPAKPASPTLLAYRFSPDVFDDTSLLQMTKQQIGQDQWAYRNTGPVKSHVFMFSQKQVDDRVIDFAAPELLPVYKQRLQTLARGMPTRFSFSTDIALSSLAYENGVIHQRNGPAGEKRSLNAAALQLDRDMMKSVGNLAVLSSMPGLTSTSPIPQPPNSLRHIPVYLALNADPTIPPIAIERAAAEHMWQQPDCSAWETAYRAGPNREEARAGARQCQEERRRYTAGLTVTYQIEIEGVVRSGSSWFLKARLLGATVRGPRNERLKELGADDFTPVMVAQPARPKGASDPTEEDPHRQQVASKFEMLGMRVGMPVAEAEKAVRDYMDVGAVFVFDKRKQQVSSVLGLYRYAKLFQAKGGREAIGLYWSPWHSDKVTGISRVIRYQESQRLAIEAALIDKYGQPSLGTALAMKGKSTSSRSQMGWGELGGDRRSCRIEDYVWDADNGRRFVQLVEGSGKLERFPSLLLNISAYGDVEKDGEVRRMMQRCLPAVTATFEPLTRTETEGWQQRSGSRRRPSDGRGVRQRDCCRALPGRGPEATATGGRAARNAAEGGNEDQVLMFRCRRMGWWGASTVMGREGGCDAIPLRSWREAATGVTYRVAAGAGTPATTASCQRHGYPGGASRARGKLRSA